MRVIGLIIIMSLETVLAALAQELGTDVKDLRDQVMVRPHLAEAVLDIQDVNDNGLITWGDVAPVIQGDWVADAATEVMTYNGTANAIIINASITQGIDGAANIQRPAPKADLERSTDGVTWEVVDSSANGYIRDTAGHEQSSNKLFFQDINPPAGVSYRIASIQESTNGGVVTLSVGRLSLRAERQYS